MSSEIYDWARDRQDSNLLDPYARAQIINNLFETVKEEN